jgi:hypothetical protein
MVSVGFRTLLVCSHSEGNLSPVTAFVESSPNGYALFPVVFNALSSSDSDGRIVRYEWYFGDGATARGIQVEHVFEDDGEYTVSITVRNASPLAEPAYDHIQGGLEESGLGGSDPCGDLQPVEQKVFTQEIAAKELEWHTNNDTGKLLANGVHLYQVWVKIADTWYPTGVHKLAVI